MTGLRNPCCGDMNANFGETASYNRKEYKSTRQIEQLEDNSNCLAGRFLTGFACSFYYLYQNRAFI